MRGSRAFESAAPWIVLAAATLIWEITCFAFSIPDFIIPSPWSVLRGLSQNAPAIADNALQTFWTTMTGFALGTSVGTLLGFMIGSSRVIYYSLYRLLVGFNSVPKSALVPILVVWFGIGSVPAILSAALLCFFPVTVNVATGLGTADPELEDVLAAMGATRLDILRKVGIPHSLPYLFASLKVAITLAFVGTIISESIASNKGIGYLMVSAGSQMMMPLVFSGLLVISVMAMVMYEIFALIERRMTSWAQRGGQGRAG
jgi:NitT/TauT family transport system permease protein